MSHQDNIDPIHGCACSSCKTLLVGREDKYVHAFFELTHCPICGKLGTIENVTAHVPSEPEIFQLESPPAAV